MCTHARVYAQKKVWKDTATFAGPEGFELCVGLRGLSPFFLNPSLDFSFFIVSYLYVTSTT